MYLCIQRFLKTWKKTYHFDGGMVGVCLFGPLKYLVFPKFKTNTVNLVTRRMFSGQY